MTTGLQTHPWWLPTVLLAEDDTEESIVGADLHQEAISQSHGALYDYAEEIGTDDEPAWYVSTQVTIIVMLPERSYPWYPKPDVFVVPHIAAHSRTSYDTRTEGPMPPFVLEVASESTWRRDVDEKSTLYQVAGVQEYLIFDPASAFLGVPMRGWHRVDDLWQEWLPVVRPDGAQVWESAVLGLAARPEGLLLRFDHPTRGPIPLRREWRIRAEAAERGKAAMVDALDEERRTRDHYARAFAAAEERAARLEAALRAAGLVVEDVGEGDPRAAP